MDFVSVVTPCYNEEGNVEVVYERVKEVLSRIPNLSYEHIFIDNASKDRTAEELRALAARDPRVKVILNTRNFGHIRSPYHALMQASGDAVMLVVADLQDPPELLEQFVAKWRAGSKVVLGVKTSANESPMMFAIRKLYYDFVARVAEVKLVKNNTGFGLYDRVVIEHMRRLDDPYPYFRGLVADLGYMPATIEYHQPGRRRGVSGNNFYTLYDIAMLGITNHSKVPLRLATMTGFAMALLSSLVAFGYFVAKLLFWNYFSMGMAPLIIGLFFFASVQLFFIGIIGEYVGSIYTHVRRHPHVVERERINFDAAADQGAPASKTKLTRI